MKARWLLLLIACFVAFALSASARVVRIRILSRTPVLDGKAFGDRGAYEKIHARVYFAVNPADPHNMRIVDLDKAPRNAAGEVEFSADLFLLRPMEPAHSNHALLLEIPNRGGVSMLRLIDGGTVSIDPATASDFGDGWLLRQGYAVASLGWQWDVADEPGHVRLYAPVATNGSKHISGLLRDDFTPVAKKKDWPLGHIITGRMGGTEYPVAAAGDARNVLTVRDIPEGARQVIPRSQWSFAHSVSGKLTPSDRFIHLDAGFEPGRIYELVYTVQDPVVAGLGFAAVRDFVSWVKQSPNAIVHVDFAYALGISQCGRYLRTLLYEGFNQDETNRQALDGILAHVGGAGRGSFNYRFAQPSRDAQPMSAIFYPTDIFPFTDQPERDPLNSSSPAEGLLDKAAAAHVAPKIFLSNTSYEYWGRAASLISTTADASRDMPIGDNVRIYMFAGFQHFSVPFPPERGQGELASQNRQSPLQIRWFWRAMISNMNAWARDGIAPPPNSYPHIANGTLVPLGKVAFPAIPGAHLPTNYNQAWRLDFGPHWRDGFLSLQPPKVGKPFPGLLPQVDADGNDRAGIHMPELTVPLATYTGWNLRDPSSGAPTARVSFAGSFFPLAKTAAERRQSGDPRSSIAERYSGRDAYLARYRQAVDDLVRQRWILPEDAAALNQRGAEEWDALAK